MATTRTTAAKTTKARKPKPPVTLTVVKQDKIIEPIQYVKLDYAVITTPSGVSLPKNRSYYGGTEGSSQNDTLKKVRLYKVGENSMMIHFGCGDYAFVNLSKFQEIIDAVKGLDVTKNPESRRA